MTFPRLCDISTLVCLVELEIDFPELLSRPSSLQNSMFLIESFENKDYKVMIKAQTNLGFISTGQAKQCPLFMFILSGLNY